MNKTIERIREIFQSTKKTQSAIARELNVTPAYIWKLLNKDDAFPSDRLIDDICRKFGVSEMWLRTGEGDMFAELDSEDEYIINLSKIDMTDNKFVQGMIRAIANSSPERLKEVENFMRDCLGLPMEEG